MEEVKHEDRTHALLSASGANRWMNCTASARLEDGIPEEDSIFAAEGTYAHELSELKLRAILKRGDVKKLALAIEEKRKDDFWSEELEEYVDVYVDYVLERFNEAKKESSKALIMLEEKVSLSDYIPEGFGTGDTGILYGSKLIIIDLKFGKGVKVEAVDNDQLKIYGLGFLSKFDLIYDIKEVEVVIVQPRLDHISSEVHKASTLVKWGKKEVVPKAKEAFEGGGVFAVGGWCKFCKLKPTCRAMKDFAFKEMQKDFSDTEQLSLSEVEEAYKASKLISDWVSSVQAHVLKEALSGTKFETLKLVRGKSNRVWADPEEALKVLRGLDNDLEESQLTTTKINGITAIEKLLGKTEFEKLALTVKPLGSPTVVERSDKRTEFEARESLEDAFSEDLEDENQP